MLRRTCVEFGIPFVKGFDAMAFLRALVLSICETDTAQCRSSLGAVGWVAQRALELPQRAGVSPAFAQYMQS